MKPTDWRAFAADFDKALSDVYDLVGKERLSSLESISIAEAEEDLKYAVGWTTGSGRKIALNQAYVEDTQLSRAIQSNSRPFIAVGRIASGYKFDKSLDVYHQHYREVEWINTEVPRSVFSSDLLFSFGAFMTVCQIKRNDAENRLKKLIELDFQKETNENTEFKNEDDEDLQQQDYELLLLDDIYKYIEKKSRDMDWSVWSKEF